MKNTMYSTEKKVLRHLMEREAESSEWRFMDYEMDGSGDCGSFIEMAHQRRIDKVVEGIGSRIDLHDLEKAAEMLAFQEFIKSPMKRPEVDTMYFPAYMTIATHLWFEEELRRDRIRESHTILYDGSKSDWSEDQASKLKVGDTVRFDAAAPGIGHFTYTVTLVEVGLRHIAYGQLVDDETTARILEPWETI